MRQPINSLKRWLGRVTNHTVTCGLTADSVRLEGDVSSLDTWLTVGFKAAEHFSHKVVNDVTVGGESVSAEEADSSSGRPLPKRSYDVVVIGGGIIGCSIVRELTKYDIRVCLLEKESDVASHATSRNDGMIHPGFAPPPGTLKAKMNVEGNRAYTDICKELDVPFARRGSLVLLNSLSYKLLLPLVLHRAKANSVGGDVRYLSKKEVSDLEPNITKDQHGAIMFPTTGQLSPYGLTIAYAEHAAQQGAEFFFDTCVTGFEKDHTHLTRVVTNRGEIRTRLVINAAGCWTDTIAALADDQYYSLHFRKGVECILDTVMGSSQTMIVAKPDLLSGRSSHSKGGGIVPCIEGNILIGPTAEEVFSRDSYDTDISHFSKLEEIMSLNTKLSKHDIITYFAGIRACSWHEDFIIERSPKIDNLIHVAGIQSPGLASAPAISRYVEKLVIEAIGPLKRKSSYNPKRNAPISIKTLGEKEKRKLLAERPDYGNIICRCEQISEGEVRDALRGPLAPTTLDGVKRRTRCGTGRCQGAFCTPRVLKILSEEYGIPIEHVQKSGHGSPIVMGRTKGDGDE